jgi:aflatoxin B1 aldehyde reductase
MPIASTPSVPAQTAIEPILGTMTFGPQVDRAAAAGMVAHFVNQGHGQIDTAHVYNEGQSERFLGDALAVVDRGRVRVATKVNPRVTGSLDAAAIRAQLEESLGRLGQDSIDILYLHFPDPRTPLEATLAACAQLHAEGRFASLGVSNFPAWQVVHAWHLCEERGWPRPVVYQGLYNALSRGVEDELMPALRALGMRFYAYNPLAGGLLAGKYTEFAVEPTPGRFTFRPNYRDRYWKPSFFDALALLTESCTREDIPIVAAAFRWLAHHSRLDAAHRDGVILGVSGQAQLEQNLAALGQGPLPATIIEAFDAAWGIARPECPAYFRTSA